MAHELQQFAARLASRARQAAWLSESARWSAPALFAIGAAIFAARFFAGVSTKDASYLLAAFALVPLVAWLRARPKFLTEAGAIAWLDRASGGTGALLTQFEHGDERWSAAANRALARVDSLPRVRLAREMGPSLLALAFVAGAAWIPKPAAPMSPSTHLAETTLESVKEQLVALEEVVALEPEKADELAERIERVQDDLDDAPTDASLEALDRTSDELSSLAEKSLAVAERAGDSLSRADGANSASEAQEALQEALKELRDGAMASQLPESIKGQLTPGSLELPAGVQLSNEAISGLSSEMRSALNARLSKLARVGLISPQQLKRATEVARVTEHVCDESCKRGGT
ncbi:MAG TPA: hypothetical protein VM509_10140 [Planctomycetota bacterium]|nr:hypothetical protein [Planctomycetota bacterium]